MVTSMIPSVDNIFVNKSIVDMRFLSAYNPLINYDWSTTTAKEYKTDGVELVVNGGFDTDSSWIKEDTWTIIDGMAIAKGFTGLYKRLSQPYQFEIGSTYKIVIECTRWVSSYVYIRKPRNSPVNDVNLRIDGVGTYTYYVTVASDRDEFAMANATTASDMDISSISIQKVIQEPNKIYSKNLGTSSTPLALYFGRGAYLNGVDQTITVPINATIQTALKRVNGIVTINETSQTLTNYVISGLGVHKDYYLFTRLLTTAEKDSYTNTPETFYAMAQADSTCVLNMPMCETSSTVRNYKTGIDYPITNYTTSVRDNAKNLQYGLQTCKFIRDSLGVIQSASDYLECNGTGYAIIPNHTDTVNIKMTVKPTSLSGNLLSGGVTKTLTGLTLNVDNDVVVSNVTPTGAITLASGFSGTIKSYKEELV